MKIPSWLLMLTLVVAVAGCTRDSGPKPAPSADGKGKPADLKAAIAANLEKLKGDDRKLAEEQRFCAVETENPLGFMGVPYKIDLQGKTVFLCCDACETRARAHADRTIAKVRQLRDSSKPESPK